MTTVNEELAAKWPTTAMAARNGDIRKAVRLFCAECMGGSEGDARRCTSETCWLYSHAHKRQYTTEPPCPDPHSDRDGLVAALNRRGPSTLLELGHLCVRWRYWARALHRDGTLDRVAGKYQIASGDAKRVLPGAPEPPEAVGGGGLDGAKAS